MLIKLLNVRWLFLLAISVSVISCSDSDKSSEIENFTNESIELVNREAKAGAGGCFEFVFPITIEFEDGTTASPDSYEELKEAIKTWRELNPNATQRPVLSYPLEVIDGDGELVSLENRLELRMLVKECKRDFVQAHLQNHHHKLKCFRLIFPVSIEFPNGEVVEAANRPMAKMILRAWKEDNPNASERPSLVFPIEVLLRDGSTMIVDSKEDLKALKEDCSN